MLVTWSESLQRHQMKNEYYSNVCYRYKKSYTEKPASFSFLQLQIRKLLVHDCSTTVWQYTSVASVGHAVQGRTLLATILLQNLSSSSLVATPVLPSLGISIYSSAVLQATEHIHLPGSSSSHTTQVQITCWVTLLDFLLLLMASGLHLLQPGDIGCPVSCCRARNIRTFFTGHLSQQLAENMVLVKI